MLSAHRAYYIANVVLSTIISLLTFTVNVLGIARLVVGNFERVDTMTMRAGGTSFVIPDGVKKKWWLVDAEGVSMGRLASRLALVLRGKNKAYYAPHMDCGDYVVVINADKVRITGDKLEQESFFWHTGYPGGIKERKWKDIMRGRYPERLLIKAVERMMPKDSPLARKQMRNLHVYAGSVHPHAGQCPEIAVVTK